MALPINGIPQEQHPLPLETRVKEAKLIVIGRFKAYYTQSRIHNTGHVEIEEILFGTVSTHKTVMVDYSTEGHFIPGIASSTHRINSTNKYTNRYICFLTNPSTTRSSNSPPEMTIVGGTACNGFESVTEKALQDTKALIAERNNKK